ncbi:DEAD/DEAH box helicase [Serratia fonticola]|uniref:DEAD/DEAH box helicase n=1 Tax=Serratia fonticola TaxID=47917 RepID=UPI0021771FC9|nr:DEAD/DEAH box helicase [Serratia fonticola]CAI1209983.1 ATP-dependent helicase [Serratia fonticola]
MLYQKNYFSALTTNLSIRSERAAQGLLSLGNTHLRKFLHDRLTGMPGSVGAWLSDPVFEPTFGWEESKETMSSLAGGRLLHQRLAQAMMSPPKELAQEYTFPGNRHPFTHQLAAWEILNSSDPQSLVVTSGTGSGKTECFLVPVLNHLANEIDAGEDTEGVRALFIYPLNALINSQQNRLDAWIDGFGGQIRHCLYTGALENERKISDQQYKGQVIDRKSLRERPPQILVTNATMLEYMLIRKDDEPILKKSAGKLRWIILDEAHTHIGSQAAEMALLLRRVMLAFQVKPQDVRFVATSATFGSDEKTIESLRTFLADIGGITPEQVHIVQGSRDIPALQKANLHSDQDAPEVIADIEAEQEQSALRYRHLESSPTARHLRSLFIPEGQSQPQSLRGLTQASELAAPRLLAWLDLMSGTKNTEGLAFLPLRAHLFHNVIPAIRACVDKQCQHKVGTPLAHEEWPFGMVYLEERTHCDCGAPLMPLVSCEECNESFLQAACTSSGKLLDQSQQQVDEFSLDEDTADESEQVEDPNLLSQTLICNRPVNYSYPEFLERTTQKLMFDGPKDSYIELQIFRSKKNECPCCGANQQGRRLLRHARIGTPFTLSTVIGTLLEFCPQDPEPFGKPFQGRKLISFTDSRQGTARIAVKLQQDSERNRIRGLVYRHLLQAHPASSLSKDEWLDINDLQLKDVAQSLSRLEKKYLQQLLEKQTDAAKGAEISWTDMVNYLAGTPDLQIGMLDYYRNLAPQTFSKNDSVNLAGMLLAREFYRRPKRANSLETLGLVQICYPKLASITNKPMAWPAHKDIESWRSYLKVLLDFFIRENTILNIDRRWQSLIGARISPKWVVPVSDGKTEKLPGRYARWPSVNTVNSVQSRAILLLCKAFNWSKTTHQDQIDLILREAWLVLTQQAKLLISSGDGYQLDLREISFRLPNEVYLCPVSRRFIDTPFEHLSPYTPRTDRDMIVKAIPYTLPRPPESLLHIQGDEGLLAIRDWVNTQPKIQQLRKDALWSDVMDLVIEGGHYFRTAEHSAQQPKKKLDEYEGMFKVGKLNLLSCSTTMEMGVDIGGVNVVAMNNVPPHPANYLQRAGRAGRRREGRSVALAVCKNTPHDQSVFNNPLWPFTTPMRMPKVSLQSPDLVQRHVNAWLLSHWLKHVVTAQEIKSMTSGAFFLKNEMPMSLAERFCLWCSNQASESEQQVEHAINDITLRSILGSVPQRSLLNRTSENLNNILQCWRQEHSASHAQLQQIANSKAAASRAMEAQLRRIEKEYLLSELADRRFLPGYGFPTDIVGFDNRCKQTIKLEETDKREDNRARYRDLASRDRITGLREYAPGAELVMDGLVYKSSGITLNWHAPASVENIKELQLLKKAWFCRHCGASDTAINPGSEVNCQECGEPIENNDIREYLIPAGFAVDFFDEPHNDISRLQYVPVKAPWLNVPASWICLANPALGQFRTSQQAQLFHYTSGVNQKGFAICLECGKAEPMLSTADTSAPANEKFLPAIFRQNTTHMRLRGGKNDDGENICPGSHNSWKIKQNIHLGHDSLTDALELVLRDPSNGELLDDDITGYSIAVALREAIAAELGVQTEELGCDSRQIRVDGCTTSAIRIFDLRSGGYTTQIAERLNERHLWAHVIKRLDSCGCANACQRCLLSFDTRFEAARLNRHAALDWINQTWLSSLALPTELTVFGPQTQAEIATLQEAIEREITRDDCSKIIGIHLFGPAEEWDLAIARNLRNQLVIWENAEHQVQLLLAESTFVTLPADQKEWLAKLAFSGIQICLHNGSPEVGPLVLNITLKSRNGNIAWASDNVHLAVPSRTWSLATAGSKIVMGPAPTLHIDRQISPAELMPVTPPGLVKIELRDQLDGELDSFASRLWHQLKNEAVGLLDDVFTGQDPVTELIYSDRYVCSPLVVNLLVSVIHELEQHNHERFTIKIQGRHYQKDDNRSPWQCWHDWRSSQERDEAIRQALEYCGLASEVLSFPSLPHYRQLQLKLRSGKQLTIQFDQGLSYWESERSAKSHLLRFDFSSSQLGEKIMERIQCKVVGSGDENTQIFISVTQ